MYTQVVSRYTYDVTRDSLHGARNRAERYRQDYLALRKRCRELIREGKIEADADFKKLVGMRD
jgi:hypothetical protein